MKLLSLFLAFITIFSMSFSVEAANIQAESYVVIEASTGEILYSKNANLSRPPASITKVLTCALALQNYDPVHLQEMTDAAVFSVPRSSSHIALTPGELVPLQDLLNATMLMSANEAANGLAEFVGGTIDNFAILMNQAALEAGAKNTNFVNANGLHEKKHLTTAYDMAMITRWALSIDGFRELFGAEKYTMMPTNIQPEERYFATKNSLMTNTKYYVEGNTGGKTGWTPEAKHTLTTLAERDGLEVICVIMGSPTSNALFTDAQILLNRTFDEYKSLRLNTKSLEFPSIALYDGTEQIGAIHLKHEELSFPVEKSLKENQITVQLRAQASYDKNEPIDPSVKFILPDGEVLYEKTLAYTVEYKEPLLSMNALQSNVSEGKNKISDNLLLYMVASIIFVSVLTLFFNYRATRIEKQYQARRRERRNKKHHR